MKLIERIRPDLIITDLMMPGVDGFQLINMVKANPNLVSTPIVVVTAKELTVRERELLDEQVDMVLQKGSFIDDAFVEKLIARLN
jgi:CheY-like chemotaxis protein